MTDSSKRKLLKALAAGGGVVAVADRWKTPTVSTVVLPAHAELTGLGQFCDDPVLELGEGPGPAPPLSALISSAMAGGSLSDPWDLCIQPTGDDTYSASITAGFQGLVLTDTGTVGVPVILEAPGGCNISLTFTVLTMEIGVTATYRLEGLPGVGTALPCICTPSDPICL